MVANDVASSASVDGWLDVPEETKIEFNSFGDEFIGKFLGWSETKTGIAQAHFENAEGAFFVNTGDSLKRQLKKVPVGKLVRMVYESDLSTGQASPMKVFKVQYK